jgi:hypothetical protein
MNKHTNLIAAINNLTERQLQLAADMETLKAMIQSESTHARIKFNEPLVSQEEFEALTKVKEEGDG